MNDYIQLVITLVGVFFIMLAGFVLHFTILYKRKKIIYKHEQETLRSTFNQELLKTQMEVQEQTLNNISKEIHDNITQVLSFVKLNLGVAVNTDESSRVDKIKESRDLIAQAIHDLRDLSRSLSFENISQSGLINTIQTEVDRVLRSGIISASFKISGPVYSLGEQRELILFRIFQEGLNNALKHAEAKELNVSLQYSADLVTLTIADDGRGFQPESPEAVKGLGLRNIENRAAMIGAESKIESRPDKGCVIRITLNPLEKKFFTHGTNINSTR